MTITPIKQQMQNVWNIPQDLSSEMRNILKKELLGRSWEEVLQIQKQAWQTPNRSSRDYLDQETQKAYDLRYGIDAAPKDYSGRLIIDESTAWKHQPQVGDLVSDFASQLEKAKDLLGEEGLFRSLKRGLNVLNQGSVPPLSVEKPWSETDDQALQKALKVLNTDQVFDATHIGAVTDALMNKINKGKKKKKESDEGQIEAPDYEEGELIAIEDIQKTFNKPSSLKIIGCIWHTESEGCENCPDEGEVFLNQEDLPKTHPNCRCTIEPIYEEESHSLTKAEEKTEVKEKIVERNIDNIILHEENKAHPYLDTKGNITVGCGKNVNDLKEFKKVNWVDENGKSLSEEEKIKMHQKISKDGAHNKDNNISANTYKNKWKIYITDAESKRLAIEHLQQNVEELRAKAKSFGQDFDKYPASVQDALLDMQYNMGGNFNEDKWEKFYKGWKKEKFEVMAKQSSRADVSDERNELTAERFRIGAQVIKANKNR